MFKVGNLRIRFKHFKYVDAGFEENKIGKFGVTCSVYLKDGDTPLFQDTVRPYYKDQPDRILGKKYALREALVNKRIKRKSAGKDILSTYIVWNFTKTERTEIWNAFWEWVESWDKKKEINPVGKTVIVYDRYNFALPLKGMVEKISEKDGAYQIGFYSNQHGYPNYMTKNHTYFFSQQCQIVKD